jgi:antitoxin MazE
MFLHMKDQGMRTSVRRMGNSAGIILPKPVLAALGVRAGDDLTLALEKGRLILMPAKAHPRSGWAKAAAAIAASGADALVWPEFGNLDDGESIW